MHTVVEKRHRKARYESSREDAAAAGSLEEDVEDEHEISCSVQCLCQ